MPSTICLILRSVAAQPRRVSKDALSFRGKSLQACGFFLPRRDGLAGAFASRCTPHALSINANALAKPASG